MYPGILILWLQEGLGILHEVGEAEGLASQVTDTQGVYFVPPFAGSDMVRTGTGSYNRGAILGVTRGVTKHHIVRAALEALAYQTRDFVEVIKRREPGPMPAGFACGWEYLQKRLSSSISGGHIRDYGGKTGIHQYGCPWCSLPGRISCGLLVHPLKKSHPIGRGRVTSNLGLLRNAVKSFMMDGKGRSTSEKFLLTCRIMLSSSNHTPLEYSNTPMEYDISPFVHLFGGYSSTHLGYFPDSF